MSTRGIGFTISRVMQFTASVAKFGRAPMSQGESGVGRDHHMEGFSIFLAGGGIKGGAVYLVTDEFGYADD